MIKHPCYDCIDRHETCHCKCKAYKEYKEEMAEQKELIRMNRVINNYVCEQLGIKKKDKTGKKIVNTLCTHW